MTFDKSNLSSKLERIQNLSDVQALPPGTDVAAKIRQDASAVAAESGVDIGDARAFEDAGWTFVKAGQAASSERGHDVVVDIDGHLKVVGKALNVKFDPALPREAADGILGKYGLSVRREMGFAPNLFLVTGDQTDLVSKAQSLNQLESVVYAEPVFIEPIKGRR